MGSVAGVRGQGDSGIVDVSTAWPYTSPMINNFSFTQKLLLVAQTFCKIAYAFWPSLLVIALVMAWLAYTESRAK
jgi:hypothetical protein